MKFKTYFTVVYLSLILTSCFLVFFYQNYSAAIFLILGFLAFSSYMQGMKPAKGSISEALERAEPGDEIMLRAGKYKENIRLKNGVTIKAMNPIGEE